MLAALLDFDPRDGRSMEEWGLQHSSDHDDVRAATQAALSVDLIDWVIYPVNWKDWDAWALRHQSAHNDANGALGLVGVDLTQVDFKDPVSREYWNQSHFREHLAWHDALAI